MKLRLGFVAGLWLLGSSVVTAEEIDARPKSWFVELGAMIGHHSNILGQSNVNGESVPSATISTLYANVERNRKWMNVYLLARGTTYAGEADVSDERMGRLGMMYKHRRFRVAAEYLVMPGTSYAEESDTDQFFDLEGFLFKGRLGSRKVWVEGRYGRENWTFDSTAAGRDAEVRKISAILRFPLGRRASLRPAYHSESKVAVDRQYGREGDGASLTLEVRPTDRVGLYARYKVRERIYDDAPPGADNFGREDDVEDMTLNIRVNIGRHWGVRIEDGYRRVASSRPGRSYDSIQVKAGVFVRF